MQKKSELFIKKDCFFYKTVAILAFQDCDAELTVKPFSRKVFPH